MSSSINKLAVEGKKAFDGLSEASIVPTLVEGLFHSFVESLKVIEVIEQQKTQRLAIEMLFAAKSVGSTLDCLESVLTEYYKYKTVYEQEQTKRQQIDAWENVEITNINAQRDMIIKYLGKAFDEREKVFQICFKAVDNAIEVGDNQQLASALSAIVEIAKLNPFNDLTNLDFVKTSLSNPGYVWKLDCE